MALVKSSALPDTIHLTKAQYESAPEDVQNELWRLGQRVRLLTRHPEHTCPDGPFTLDMKVPLIADQNGTDSGQVAEVTYSMPKGQVPTRTDIEDALKEALTGVAASLEGYTLRFMRRDEFENYVITGSPDISFATGGPDGFALNLDLDTEKET